MSFARLLALSALTVLLPTVAGAAGPGDFEEAPTSPESTGVLTHTSVNATRASDYNSDGNDDLAVGTEVGDVSILLGDGNGDFSPSPTSPEPGPLLAIHMEAGDFNGDDAPDLAAVGAAANSVTILLNDGAGDFPVATTETTGSDPVNVVPGRFDGNNTLDLAVANSVDDSVTILLGDGTGNFTEAAGTSPEMVGDSPRGIAVGDFNDDGRNDLAVANGGTSTVTILLGDGTGNFTDAGNGPETGGASGLAIAAARLNGDRNLDLAVSDYNNAWVTILFGDGTGDFTEAGTSPEAVGLNPIGLVADRLARGEHTDLAVVNQSSNDVSILLGDGTGDFTEAATSPEMTGLVPISMTGGDFNNDPATDLAVLNQSSADITILLNTSPVSLVPTPGPPGPGPGQPPPGESPPAGTCRNQAATIVGTSGDDSIRGTRGDDIIFGLAGDDSVAGGLGNDLICLGDGDDLGRGGKGNDLVIGNRDDDELLGNKGIDQLFGRKEDDTLKGGKGADSCGGGQGNDTKQGCEASPS